MKTAGASRLVTTEPDPAWIPALLQQDISPLMQQGMLFRRNIVRRLKGTASVTGFAPIWISGCADTPMSPGAKFRYYPENAWPSFVFAPASCQGSTATTRHEQDEIVKRHLPVPVAPWNNRFARWRYRACNLPRYLERTRTRGFRTSYQLLERQSCPAMNGRITRSLSF